MIRNTIARSFSTSTKVGISYTPLSERTKKLRQMLNSKDMSYLMEAHNGLSARIVEEAGFQGIWGSGLSISASMGYRDSNEASYTQVLEVCEQMSWASGLPILLDADTGYGNFNNARLLVRKLESRGIAGACIEDKLFPKSNSLLGDSETKPLADISEFSHKIMAMKDHQTDPNFCVVARVEAFIAGWGLEEALKRAEAYAAAGADALLMHSKKADSSDIRSFMNEWNKKSDADKTKIPVVIVPTKYYTEPTQDFKDMNISTIIWANHNLRSSVAAMQETCRSIKANESLVEIEDKKHVVPVKEVFRLQRQDELSAAEKVYLPEIKL